MTILDPGRLDWGIGSKGSRSTFEGQVPFMCLSNIDAQGCSKQLPGIHSISERPTHGLAVQGTLLMQSERKRQWQATSCEPDVHGFQLQEHSFG